MAIYLGNDKVAGGISEQEDNDIYSTQETKTDKVWIDGKPIYRKVLSFITTDELHTMKIINTGINNIDLCFFGEMSLIKGTDGSIYPVNAARPNTDTSIGLGANNWFRLNPNKRDIAYVISTLATSSQCYLELYYTKTTD